MEFFKGLCSFLAGLAGLYSFLIVVRIILSWIVGFSRMNGWRSGYGGYGYANGNGAGPSGVEKASDVIARGREAQEAFSQQLTEGLTAEELEICFRCFAVFGENMARLTGRRGPCKEK